MFFHVFFTGDSYQHHMPIYSKYNSLSTAFDRQNFKTVTVFEHFQQSFQQLWTNWRSIQQFFQQYVNTFCILDLQNGYNKGSRAAARLLNILLKTCREPAAIYGKERKNHDKRCKQADSRGNISRKRIF